MNIFSLVARLALDKTDYEKGISDAVQGAQGIGAKLKTSFGVAAAAATAVAGAASAAAAVVTKEVGALASYGDNIDKMSQKLGISAQAYQEWDAIMQHSGTSIDSMTAGMKTLVNAAASGNEAFEAIGLTQEKIASMNQEQLFSATITALQSMEDESQRTVLATKLLGRSAMELGPLLNTSAEDTEAMRQQVHKLGGVMSDEAVKASAAYQDRLQDLQTAIQGTKRNLLSDFLPAITTVMDGLTEVFSGEGVGAKMEEGLQMFADMLAEALPRVLETGSQIVVALGNAIVENLPKLASAASQTLIMLANGIVQQLPMLVQAGLEIVVQLAQAIADNLPELIPTIVDVILQIVDILTEPNTLSNLIDAAIAIILAIQEGLIKAAPRIIEAVPTIIAHLFSAILQAAPKLLEAGGELILNLANGIVNGLDEIGRAIGRIVTAIGDGIGDAVQAAWDWGADMINNFTDGIKAFVSKPIDAVKGLASKITNFLGFSEPEEGPLSNFHTFAPDMMALFAQGIEQNKNLITGAIGDAFDFAPQIAAAQTPAGGQEIVVPRNGAETPRDLTIIVKLPDDTELGRAIYRMYNNEKNRTGDVLAMGRAY